MIPILAEQIEAKLTVPPRGLVRLSSAFARHQAKKARLFPANALFRRASGSNDRPN